jgi:hypothetical protein
MAVNLFALLYTLLLFLHKGSITHPKPALPLLATNSFFLMLQKIKKKSFLIVENKMTNFFSVHFLQTYHAVST